MMEVGGATGGVGLRRSTPHLASPLEGGRDELGEGWVLVGWWARRAARGERGFLPAQE